MSSILTFAYQNATRAVSEATVAAAQANEVSLIIRFGNFESLIEDEKYSFNLSLACFVVSRIFTIDSR